MTLDSEKGSRLSPAVKDCLIHFDIREHHKNDVKEVATVTANLAEFTTPPSTMGTMRKTVLFPIKMSSMKTANLKLSITSIWLNTQAPSVDSLLESRKKTKHSSYVVLEEDKELPIPVPVKSPRGVQMVAPRVFSNTLERRKGTLTPRSEEHT